MNNFFNADNAFFTFLGKVCDLILLSAMWFLLCIPVVTIGPASTALYYATVKVIRRERGYLYREFFKSFKLNFKKGAIIGVVMTILYLVLAFDIYATWMSASSAGSDKTSVFLGVYIAISLILTCFTLYVYPVLSRFDMKLKQLLKLVFYMSMKHVLYTLGMLIVLAAAVVLVLFNFMFIFIVPAGSTFVNSLLMERILKKYIPKNEQSGEESEDDRSIDKWYLE